MYENLRTGHEYLLQHFPDYDYRSPLEPHRLDMRRRDNIVGYWQRAVLVRQAIECCLESCGIGLELGSAGVKTPWCLSTDARTGLRSLYPVDTPILDREIVGGHLRIDASMDSPTSADHDYRTDIFRDGSFSLVATSHVLEHIAGNPLDTLTEWTRLLVSGGRIVVILPDNRWVDVMRIDPDHKHAWDGEKFLGLATQIPGCRVVEHTAETQRNYHSFATVWEKL